MEERRRKKERKKERKKTLTLGGIIVKNLEFVGMDFSSPPPRAQLLFNPTNKGFNCIPPPCKRTTNFSPGKSCKSNSIFFSFSCSFWMSKSWLGCGFPFRSQVWATGEWVKTNIRLYFFDICGEGRGRRREKKERGGVELR